MMTIYIYASGRIIEATPDKVEVIYARFYKTPKIEGYRALFNKQTNAETKGESGYYERLLPAKEGEIKNHCIWLKEKDLGRAVSIFEKDLNSKLEIARKKFEKLLDEKERLESSY